ncbi:hypothetical protein BH09PAT3_BH09PAT3_4420 [soil metagenome]
MLLAKIRSRLPGGKPSLFKPAAPVTPLSTGQRIIATIVILGSMVGAALISYFFLIHQSLRLDEAQTIWQSSHSLSGVLHVVALDVHVPLYHVLVHFWIFYFGDSVVAVRSLSLLFFLLTIPVIFAIARQLLPLRWALFAVILFSFSPFMDWYASEARMYTLLVLIASLNQFFFLKITRKNKGWIGFALTALVGAYSHYFFLFTLAAQGIYFLLRHRYYARRSLQKMIAIAVLVLLALSPWLYYFRSLGSAGNTRPLLVTPSSVDFSNVFSQFIFGFQTDYINTILLSSWPLIMLISLIAVRRSKKIDVPVSIMMTMAVLPIILAFVISLLVQPFFVSRYMVACVAPLLLVIVWLISQYRKSFATGAAILLIVITGVSSFQQAHSAATPIKEDYKAAVEYINKRAVPQDLVVISSPFTIYPIEYYYTGAAQIQTLPLWNRTSAGAIPAFNEKTLPQDVAKQNENHRYIYLLLSHDQGYEDTISQYYLSHFKQLKKQVYSDDLTLYVYQVGYYSVPPLDQATEPVE